MRHIVAVLSFTTLALAAFAAPAQDAPETAVPAADPGILLGVESGSVLVSSGGEFTQAASGQVLAPGQRVLVSEGGSASLGYANGCKKTMSTPGVYTVAADCVADSSRGVDGRVIAGIVGGVAVIAAAAGGGGGGGSPPVSR
ncbi:MULTISPECIES: hypothetical protein [unclassified Luteimonas]